MKYKISTIIKNYHITPYLIFYISLHLIKYNINI